MKIFEKIIFAVSVAAALVSCNNGFSGAGDAKIGFEQNEYRFSENQASSNGYVRIPVIVTGEPKSYPVTFDIKATLLEGIEDLGSLVKITQTQGLKYRGNKDVPASVELYIMDDNVINGDRSFTLNISYSDGATISNAATTVIIEDDDDALYKKLVGDWTFTGTGVMTGEKKSFDVNISLGFTDAEMEENLNEDRLVCWGFADAKNVYENANLSHQAVWYLKCDKESNAVEITIGNVMTTEVDFEIDYPDPYDKMYAIAASLIPANPSGRLSYSSEAGGIGGSWSDDFNTITFDSNSGFGGVIAVNTAVAGEYKITNYFMEDVFHHIVLTRK